MEMFGGTERCLGGPTSRAGLRPGRASRPLGARRWALVPAGRSRAPHFLPKRRPPTQTPSPYPNAVPITESPPPSREEATLRTKRVLVHPSKYVP